MLTKSDLDWFAARLSIAVYDTNREIRMGRTTELREATGLPLEVRFGAGVQYITLNGTTIEVSPMATAEEIKALLLPVNTITQEPKMPTIAEQLKAAKAKMAEARDTVANAVSASNDAATTAANEGAKVLKEAQDMLAEVAELTNGGPA